MFATMFAIHMHILIGNDIGNISLITLRAIRAQNTAFFDGSVTFPRDTFNNLIQFKIL